MQWGTSDLKELYNRVRTRKSQSKKKISKTHNHNPITPEIFLNALEGTHGIIKLIAERLNKSYHAVWTYIDKAPEDIQELIQREKEKLGDIAELAVEEMILQSIHYPTKLSAAKFVLTSSKHSQKRGYKEKQEFTFQGGDKPIQIQNENLISMDKLKSIPLDVRKQMLEELGEDGEEGDEE